MFYSRHDEARLYYLLMISDDELSKDEKEKFDQICESLKINDLKKQEIIDDCIENMRGKLRNYTIFKRCIDNILCSDEYSIENYRSNTAFDKQDEGKIIWTMINLSYSDNDFSDNEKVIIQYLVKVFEVDEGLLADMLDTAETIQIIVNQIEWMKNSNQGYNLINKETIELQRRIEEQFKNIEISISEIDCA